MKRIDILTLAAAALLLGACDVVGIRGNGEIATDQRTIGDFNEIKASGGIRVEWQAGPPSLSITTDKNLLRYIETRIEGNTLRIRMQERVRPSHRIDIAVSSSKLNGGDLSGAVTLVAKNVAGPKFFVRASGASDITVDGNADEFLADLTGATDLRAKGLQTRTSEISSTGASSASVAVSETLRVSITGAGDVNYYGNPQTIEKHITGAGSIHHKE